MAVQANPTVALGIPAAADITTSDRQGRGNHWAHQITAQASTRHVTIAQRRWHCNVHGAKSEMCDAWMNTVKEHCMLPGVAKEEQGAVAGYELQLNSWFKK